MLDLIARIISMIISLYMILYVLSSIKIQKTETVIQSLIPKPQVSQVSVVESADYVIETDGITTYVKNKNGIIVYSSMDSASAIQYAIDSLPGGKVLIRVGTYNLSKPINIQKKE